MMPTFVANSNGTVVVQVERIEAIEVNGLSITMKRIDGSDLVWEKADDESDLAAKKTRTASLFQVQTQ